MMSGSGDTNRGSLEALDRFWRSVSAVIFASETEKEEAEARKKAEFHAPVIWLLGKTGAGKTAIVSALTGDPRAVVGKGFKPCTRDSWLYELPEEAPVLRFLDTRGLGEHDYDPAADIGVAKGRSQAILVVMKVKDPIQDVVIDVVRQARKKNPRWPVIVAQTGLHQLYRPGDQHLEPYPFSGDERDLTDERLPKDLRLAIRAQRAAFDQLPGRPPSFVLLDFTLAEDDYEPSDYGLDALEQALIAAGLDIFAWSERQRSDRESDQIAAAARPLILGYATAAAATAATPVPGVGLGGLAVTNGLMLRDLAERYRLRWTPEGIAHLSGAIGAATLLGWMAFYGLREMLKLVPGVGTAAAASLNASASFALSIGIGSAACVYLAAIRRGEVVTEEVRENIRRAFEDAFRFRRALQLEKKGKSP